MCAEGEEWEDEFAKGELWLMGRCPRPLSRPFSRAATHTQLDGKPSPVENMLSIFVLYIHFDTLAEGAVSLATNIKNIILSIYHINN